jgi:hypothetical protein
MTYNQYRLECEKVKAEIALLDHVLDGSCLHRRGDIRHDARDLRKYYRDLRAWYWGSRVGTPPVHPELVF